MTKYGVLKGLGLGTGIALPRTHPVPPTPGTPPLPAPAATVAYSVYSGLLMAVGLISVAQLSLYGHFSEIRTITEVYNLLEIGNR